MFAALLLVKEDVVVVFVVRPRVEVLENRPFMPEFNNSIILKTFLSDTSYDIHLM